MRIGYDAKRIFNNRAGLGSYGRTLIDNMLRFHSSDSLHMFTPAIALQDMHARYASYDQVLIHQKRGLSNSYWRSRGITNDIINLQIEIYHGLSHELPINIKKSTCKSVVTIHDVIFKKFPEYFTFFDRMIYDQKWKHAIGTADKIIAISDSTKEDILRYYPDCADRIEVVYSPCHPRYYRDYAPSADLGVSLPSQYILSVGSLEPRKNYETLLRALAQFGNETRPQLVIVGRGSKKYVDRLQGLILSLKLRKDVTILSNIDDLQLQTLYHHASALIYPSYYEGHGLPITEALLSEIPVVASATSSMQEAGGPDCIYINPKDTEELKSAIERVLTDSTLQEKMIVNGLKYAKQTFDPQKLSNQMYRAYKSLL